MATGKKKYIYIYVLYVSTCVEMYVCVRKTISVN
jgi:hypothetical protein